MKNQKIKEMEELLVMMSRKDVAKVELESLRTESQINSSENQTDIEEPLEPLSFEDSPINQKR